MTKKRRIFARFVVDARDDADIWTLSDAAFRVWWSAILWCRDKGNDGLVPTPMVSGLSPVKNARKAIAELEQHGFVTSAAGGWQIRNYELYQDTRETIEQRQAASAVANAAQGKANRNGSEPVTEPVPGLEHSR